MKQEIEVIFYKMTRESSLHSHPEIMQASFAMARNAACTGNITFPRPIPDLKFSKRYRLTIEELPDGRIAEVG